MNLESAVVASRLGKLPHTSLRLGNLNQRKVVIGGTLLVTGLGEQRNVRFPNDTEIVFFRSPIWPILTGFSISATLPSKSLQHSDEFCRKPPTSAIHLGVIVNLFLCPQRMEHIGGLSAKRQHERKVLPGSCIVFG
jgi:hypothetical protein